MCGVRTYVGIKWYGRMVSGYLFISYAGLHFCIGFFMHFDRKRIVNSLIYPYILFQILYLVFDAMVINHNPAILNIQFTTPYWLLWYLLVMIFYYLLLPFMEGMNCMLLLVSGTALSLLSGFDQSIGYYLSLSRFLRFCLILYWVQYGND